MNKPSLYIAMVGDSLTYDFRQMDPLSEPELEELLKRLKVSRQSVEVLNVGKSGMTSRDWVLNPRWWAEVERFFVKAPEGAKKLAFIMIGTNDCAMGHPPSAYANNLKDMVERVRAMKAEPILQTIVPLPAYAEGDALITKYNEELKALAEKEKLKTLDINKLFRTEEGRIKTAFYDFDMVHLKDEPGLAYDTWLDALGAHIRGNLP